MGGNKLSSWLQPDSNPSRVPSAGAVSIFCANTLFAVSNITPSSASRSRRTPFPSFARYLQNVRTPQIRSSCGRPDWPG